MKPANILSFSEISDQTCKKSYEKYLGINIKDEEFLCLKKFCSLLQAEHPSIEVYNNFYIGYNIPQISKEFDLLRIDDNLVIDIELKKTSTSEKIKKQLIQNQHYLSYLNRKILLVTFEKDSSSIYTLDKDNQLITIDINGLISELESQNHPYTGDLNKLFNPSNYLVSPFNSTGAFLDGKYFLTNQQEEFKTRVTNSFKSTSHNIIGITGKAGTGKTLLLYDLAKHFIEEGKRVKIFHVGNLNKGHYTLISCGWHISPVKDVYNVIINAIDAQRKSKFDIIILDETQRINTTQLDLILKFVLDNQLKCIISYDPVQTLSNTEKNSKAIPTIEANCIDRLELSEKIRTNKNLAQFIRSVFNLNKKSQIIPEDVSIIHFQNESTAKAYISTKNDFRLINYTPSRYYQDHLDDFQLLRVYEGTSHSVIGQEFDNVIVIIDNFFYYDGAKQLKSIGRPGNPYDQVNMLRQAMTRVKRKLEIVVIKNQPVFGEVLKLLFPQ